MRDRRPPRTVSIIKESKKPDAPRLSSPDGEEVIPPLDDMPEDRDSTGSPARARPTQPSRRLRDLDPMVMDLLTTQPLPHVKEAALDEYPPPENRPESPGRDGDGD